MHFSQMCNPNPCPRSGLAFSLKSNVMKMLFFSSEEAEVELVCRELTGAGLNCEIRRSPVPEGSPNSSGSGEVWIHKDKDCHHALVLCVERGIGFSKRTVLPEDDDADD